MSTTLTLESESEAGAGESAQWAVCVALDGERVDGAAERFGLGGLAAVEIGRGEALGLVRTTDKGRITVANHRVSRVHARLLAADEGWTVEDAGSKNGTRVNGAVVQRRRLDDGDVFEVAGTFLVMRRVARGGERNATAMVRTLSPRLERELTVAGKLARSNLPILLRGESGTGKEIVAAAVHASSQRPGPLVAVNCGALPAGLVESELFGSRKGAFSGAEDRRGLVRAAERGTLFLDEVAELPLAAQGALLRLLQQGEVQTLGSDRPSAIDVRVLAATHRPLEEMVTNGTFRKDLFARLRGCTLSLPPLRERIEDLGILCADLLRRIEPDGPPRSLSPSAARALFEHAWPYNVRELEQLLRTAVATAKETELGLSDFGPFAASPEAPRAAPDDRARLVAMLERHAGNLSAVAREMSTSRTQVQRLLERHELDARDFKR